MLLNQLIHFWNENVIYQKKYMTFCFKNTCLYLSLRWSFVLKLPVAALRMGLRYYSNLFMMTECDHMHRCALGACLRPITLEWTKHTWSFLPSVHRNTGRNTNLQVVTVRPMLWVNDPDHCRDSSKYPSQTPQLYLTSKTASSFFVLYLSSGCLSLFLFLTPFQLPAPP